MCTQDPVELEVYTFMPSLLGDERSTSIALHLQGCSVCSALKKRYEHDNNARALVRALVSMEIAVGK